MVSQLASPVLGLGTMHDDKPVLLYALRWHTFANQSQVVETLILNLPAPLTLP